MFIAKYLFKGAGTGQPVNGAIPSLPSPTMPTFNMAAQTPNGQPGGTEAVYTNGIPQTYPARKYFLQSFIAAAGRAQELTIASTISCILTLPLLANSFPPYSSNLHTIPVAFLFTHFVIIQVVPTVFFHICLVVLIACQILISKNAFPAFNLSLPFLSEHVLKKDFTRIYNKTL